jgi:peptidoglycan/xylan/chitin deacetylase (PgdA/CDA1 family)
LSAGQFVISLDFELHWGVRDHTGVDDYRDNLLGVRQVVPALLARFRQREIHATWGTVGILFARTREEALEHAPRRRPGYKKRELDPYVDLENAGVDEQQDPFHFAGSLVEQVAATPHQELATHTYSHYYCLETGPMMADFEDDLRAAKSIGCRYGDVTKSIVFPRNQFDEAHLEAARRAGTVAFRGNPLTWFWRPHAYDQETVRERAFRFADAYFRTGPVRQVRPRRHPSGLVDVPATRFLRPWSPSFAPLETLKLRRIRAELTSAARHGGLCHLWWHPHNFGRYPTQNLAMLDQILDIVDELRAREGLQSLTMAEAAATA